MASTTSKRLGAVFACAALLAVGLWLLHRQQQPRLAPSQRPSVAPKPVVAAPVPAVPEPVVEVSPADAVQRANEEVATLRMYEAHAPLRTAAVANPDSPENREVLQTMVMKALRSQGDGSAQVTKP